MVSVDVLKELLPLLKSHGVIKFNSGDVNLEFSSLGSQESTLDPSALDGLRKQEESLPADLRTDNINNMDAVLNWSSPSVESGDEVPLTGDMPL